MNDNMLQKEAIGNVTKALTDSAKYLIEQGKKFIITPWAAAIPLSAIATAAVYQKLKSPTVIAKNMDRRLLLNTLDTEIEVAERQLAALDEQRNRKTEKLFDRFV